MSGNLDKGDHQGFDPTRQEYYVWLFHRVLWEAHCPTWYPGPNFLGTNFLTLPSRLTPPSPRRPLHPLEADRLLLGRLPHCPEGGRDLRDHNHEAKRQKRGKY